MGFRSENCSRNVFPRSKRSTQVAWQLLNADRLSHRTTLRDQVSGFMTIKFATVEFRPSLIHLEPIDANVAGRTYRQSNVTAAGRYNLNPYVVTDHNFFANPPRQYQHGSSSLTVQRHP